MPSPSSSPSPSPSSNPCAGQGAANLYPSPSCIVSDPVRCGTNAINKDLEGYGVNELNSLTSMFGYNAPTPTAVSKDALSQAKQNLQDMYNQTNQLLTEANSKWIGDMGDDLKSANKLMGANIQYHDEILNDEIGKVNIILVMYGALLVVLILYITTL
jgi:hypothetical protein